MSEYTTKLYSAPPPLTYYPTDYVTAYAVRNLGAVVRNDQLDVEAVTGGASDAVGASDEVTNRGAVSAVRRRLRGLSNDHILTVSAKKPSIQVWADGGLVKISKGSVVMPDHKAGKRGDISTMSRASRRRLMYFLGTIKRDTTPDFVTLTYPGSYEYDARTSKKHLEAMRRRLERAGMAAIWRLEYKVRRSGASEGESVPHYHLILWRNTAEYCCIRCLRRWVARAWHEIAGGGDVDHAKAGTSVEVMRSWRGVMWYASKYICKVDVSSLPKGVGRMWGIINESILPVSAMTETEITLHQARGGIRFLEGLVGYEMRDGCPSMSALVDKPGEWAHRVRGLADIAIDNPGAVDVVVAASE